MQHTDASVYLFTSVLFIFCLSERFSVGDLEDVQKLCGPGMQGVWWLCGSRRREVQSFEYDDSVRGDLSDRSVQVVCDALLHLCCCFLHSLLRKKRQKDLSAAVSQQHSYTETRACCFKTVATCCPNTTH